jgi:putative redox protein
MATDISPRRVTLERVQAGRYAAVNDRGGRLVFGTGSGEDFTPVDLLMAAIGGCTAIDVDAVTSRRAEPDSFEIAVDADKVRDNQGYQLMNIVVTYRIAFAAGAAGDQARAILPDIVRKSHERLCTVSRTIELGTPIATRIE